MALEAIIAHSQFQRVILEERPEGVYVLVFRAGERSPCQDHLQDNWGLAKQHALEDFGVAEEMWREIPDTRLMG